MSSFADASPAVKADMSKLFRNMDRDHKGFVGELDELRDAKPYFTLRDADHDGWMSVKECARFIPSPHSFI